MSVNRSAIILFIRDEREESRAKPLPTSVRRHVDYSRVNDELFRRVEPLQGEFDVIVATTGTRLNDRCEHVLSQRGSTFSERIADSFEQAFALGYQSVVAVGNDCPTMTCNDIRRAFRALDGHSGYVASPAIDGGVFLVGASASTFDRESFASLRWKTSLLQRDLESIGCSLIGPSRLDADNWTEPTAYRWLLTLSVSQGHHLSFLPHRRTPSVRVRKALTRTHSPSPPAAL